MSMHFTKQLGNVQLHMLRSEDVSPFVNDDKFSVIKDSFNDDNTEILLLLLNYQYDFCHIGYIILLSDWTNQ